MSILTSEFNEVAEGDLGEERILLGKIAEGGRSEPLNFCYALFPYKVGENFVRKVFWRPSVT